MRKSKRILVLGVVTLMGLFALSGCHGGPAGPHKIQFVNEADSKKVMEITLEDPPVLARVHMAVFRTHIRGTYLLKDGSDTTAKGRVIQDDTGYTLFLKDDKKQRFEVKDRDFLKGEGGETWKLVSNALVKELKKW